MGSSWQSSFPARSAHNQTQCNDSTVSLHVLTRTYQSSNVPDIKSNTSHSFLHDLLVMTLVATGVFLQELQHRLATASSGLQAFHIYRA